MANLSSSEKKLYDELVSQGNYDAVAGMNLIALSRQGMQGQTVQLPNGKSFNPTDTQITSENIKNFFEKMFVDPSGDNSKNLDALASYLNNSSKSS